MLGFIFLTISISNQYHWDLSAWLLYIPSRREGLGGGEDSHIKVTRMLVRTFKLNPLGRPMRVWLKLELNPKGDFCVVSVRAFFVNSFIHITKRYLNWQRKWLSIPNTLNETDTLKRDKEHPHHFYTGDRDRPPPPPPPPCLSPSLW